MRIRQLLQTFELSISYQKMAPTKCSWLCAACHVNMACIANFFFFFLSLHADFMQVLIQTQHSANRQ